MYRISGFLAFWHTGKDRIPGLALSFLASRLWQVWHRCLSNVYCIQKVQFKLERIWYQQILNVDSPLRQEIEVSPKGLPNNLSRSGLISKSDCLEYFPVPMRILQWSCLGFTASFGEEEKKGVAEAAGLTGICSPNRMYPNRIFERLNAWRNQVRWRLAVTMQHVNTVDSRRYGKVEEKSTPTGERTVLFLLNSVRSWVEGSFPVSPHPGQV